MRRGRLSLAEHALNLPDLLHQLKLGGKAAGGIGEHDVDAPRPGGPDGIEHDSAGIASRLRDDGHVVTLAPDLELLPRRGAKRVAGREQQGEAFLLEMSSELADRSGLA